MRTLRPETAIFWAVLYFLAVLNLAFWQRLVATVAPKDLYELLFVAATVAVAFCLLALFFGLFAVPRVFKPAMTIFLLLGAAVAYFINEYGIVIDAGMVRNIFATNTAEAADLLAPKLFFYVVVLGCLPTFLLWTCTIAYRPFWQELWFRTKATAVLVAVILLLSFPFMQNVTSVFRENRILLHVFTPLNYLRALTDYSGRRLRSSAMASVRFGDDARMVTTSAGRPNRSLTVIVIGETARAANFSLNGYGRETNPLLSKVPGLINYTAAYSCGTSTAQSVPCMFSGLGRAGYRNRAHQDGLLQILIRAGFSVLWRENQAGCAGACAGVPIEVLARAGTRSLFELGESRDENLVAGLQEKIDAMQGHSVVVLHMMGSHGPAYFKRYPEGFERFKPTCKESQFSRCARSEIINSYDNTIVYTDYVLSRTIELLQANDDRGLPSAMIYMSDHGESLGENNTYLHGLPYVLAPDVQKHVPMLVWLSPKMRAGFRLDTSCLAQHRHEPVSHDNLFHSVLGLLNVETKVYSSGLDIFARCRAGHVAGPAQ